MRIGNLVIRREEPDLLKGIAAGLVAGLVATWAKNAFQQKWTDVQKAIAAAETPKPPRGQQTEQPSTEKVAQAVASLMKKPLTDEERKQGGVAVDYGFGALAGGAYGAVSEFVPEFEASGGLLFGGAVWLVADELGVPAVGLAKWPNSYPPSVHAYSLGGHLVYGVTAELVRRIVRRVIG